MAYIPSLVLDGTTYAENVLATVAEKPFPATAREAKAHWRLLQTLFRNAGKVGKLYGNGTQRAKAHREATAKLAALAFQCLLHVARLAMQEAKAAKAAKA